MSTTGSLVWIREGVLPSFFQCPLRSTTAVSVDSASVESTGIFSTELKSTTNSCAGKTCKASSFNLGNPPATRI